LPANRAALTARFVEGSRDGQWLRVSYEPGPTAFNFTALSGASMAEMLDQAATHCGSFVTGHPCPRLTMTVTILRPGQAKRYLATGRAMKVTGVTALLAADLTDDQAHHIASATLVSISSKTSAGCPSGPKPTVPAAISAADHFRRSRP
jgi:acyl-coenzyme A thioesterase PaaI-like protein